MIRKTLICYLIILISLSCSRITSEYLTVDKAIASLKVPEAAAKLSDYSKVVTEIPAGYRPPYRSIEPIKLFDNLYFVGTTVVGAFIIDSGDGLIMIDAGNGDTDAEMMANDMKKLGLDPSEIKVIFISHEHFDHYGGVRYLKKNVCTGAKVAMSLTGWNLLQSVPPEWVYVGSRPESVDIFLHDGMKIKIGNTYVQAVATPGHSPGCLSYIFPVYENGEKHMAGVMGGRGVWPTDTEAKLYKSSVEYFKAVASDAGCDVGLWLHSSERDFAALRSRKEGEPNPLIIGKDQFDSVYLQKYRDSFRQMMESGKIPAPVI
jgi:metallo-beta-lactamase class B